MQFQITISDKLRNFSDHVEVKQFQENGVIVGEYYMSLSDIIRALSNSAVDGVMHETPFLPKNCIKLITRGTGYEVFIEIPKRKWQVQFGDKKLLLGFPRLIFKYYILKNSIYNLKIFAIKDRGFINGDTELFYFPYSNVHHDTGDVCMGLNVFPEITELTQLEQMHLLFFTSPFGTDYGSRALGLDLSGLITTFHDKDFNDEVLIPVNKTFNELLISQV